MLLLGCQGYIQKTDWAPVKSIITNSNCTVFDELNWYLLSFLKFTLEWKLIQSLLKDIDTNDMKFIRFTREYMKTSNYD